MTTKNYYVCLRFEGRPQIHMTLRYLKNLTPSAVARVIETIDDVMRGNGRKSLFDQNAKGPKSFTPVFNIQGWYGPSYTVRVLQACHNQAWPGWLTVLQAELPNGGSEYQYHSHVACKDKRLAIEVVAVSLMCRKIEIARWELA